MKQLTNILTVFLGLIGCCSAILVCFILFIYPNLKSNASGADSESPAPSAAITSEDTSIVSEQADLQIQTDETDRENILPETDSDSEPLKSGTYIIDDIEFWFSDSVINDVTGKWRISSMTSSKDITEYAVDYYNTLFHSDDEIHAITNFSLNTTTSISVLSKGMLDVAVHEYVSGEEHDANTLFSGTLLAEYFINTNTGEIENISDNRPSPGYSTDNSEPDNSSESAQDTTPVEQEDSASANDTVWLSTTGVKYHSINNCGQTDPDKAYQVSLEYAIREGYEKCDKCF